MPLLLSLFNTLIDTMINNVLQWTIEKHLLEIVDEVVLKSIGLNWHLNIIPMRRSMIGVIVRVIYC